MKALTLTYLGVCLLAACGKSTETTAAAPPLNPNAPTVAALPFTIEGASLSDLFKNDLKVAIVKVGVNGGSAAQWSATSIAIAEKVATFGVDSIEVSVRRNEVTQSQGERFREVAHTYYSPNPSHSVWDDKDKWKVLQADAAHLSTQQDVNIYNDFSDLNDKLIEKGMDTDAADRKAGAVIAKKYHLPKDWRLPVGNVLKDVSRDSMNVDAAPASDGLAALDRCLNGKIVRMMTRCEDTQ
ncbi:hypothetical protein DO71_177 [Burkholderia pseudomallei]|uniref:hypothetical protein n=1 Tax=Burkholderia pseudomallei TaxID=28450 RepID=UPI00050E9E8A|nr:hypothetical protein [Burkholderia pseudomallei]AIV63070.1 hypothetical protein X993_2088 [Burkholderia pseudomallei K42]KGC76681.1 hypothetical protein DO71_177 [Burkholderia pseudomallei]KGS68857.1 hypothetical protein X990_3272 [Burkholderia pseudomallei MSHR4868]KGV10813.1 hypothetical protein X891_1591 [Burkholderia pseudomallei TSV 43]KGV40966.1 hypothetical protein X893_1130 [Burkholderia pseudomallei TSV 31]